MASSAPKQPIVPLLPGVELCYVCKRAIPRGEAYNVVGGKSMHSGCVRIDLEAKYRTQNNTDPNTNTL